MVSNGDGQNVLFAQRTEAHLDVWASENPELHASQYATARHSIACLPVHVEFMVLLQLVVSQRTVIAWPPHRIASGLQFLALSK